MVSGSSIGFVAVQLVSVMGCGEPARVRGIGFIPAGLCRAGAEQRERCASERT